IRRGSIVVACNLGDCPAAVRAGGGGELLLGSDPEVRLEGQVVQLPTDSVAVLSVALLDNQTSPPLGT
ncbi:MAG: DUF3459 domain-containing protein, partial [Vicinamibacterales bacterium]